MAFSRKRDMGMIRSLLLEIEGGSVAFNVRSARIAEAMGEDPSEALPDDEAHKLEMHLSMLAEAKLIIGKPASGGLWHVERITWEGYEFLETVRDGEIWKRTKSAAEKIGNSSIAMVWELAKAYGKQMAVEKLGIPLG